MIAELGAVGCCLEFLEFSRGVNRFIVGLYVALVGLGLGEQIIGIDCDVDPVGPFSWWAGS